MTALEAVVILMGAAVAVPAALYLFMPTGPQAIPVSAREMDDDLAPMPAK
jgi:hypothetical protein